MKSAIERGLYQKSWGALFSAGYIRDIRFFRPIDPACAGLYAIGRRIKKLGRC